MKDYSLDELRDVIGDLPAEPVSPDRGQAVRRRARHVRQRRSALTAAALAVPAVGFGVWRSGDADNGDVQVVSDYPTLAVTPAPRLSSAPSKAPRPATAPTKAAPVATSAAPTKPAVVVQPTKSAPAPIVHPGPGLQVRLTGSATKVDVGEKVSFTLAWSDTDGHYLGYEMSYGDIGAAEQRRAVCRDNRVHPSDGGSRFSHAWSAPGTYRVYYTIRTGGCGAGAESDTGSVVVTVRAPEPPPTTAPPSPPAEPTPTAPAS